MEELIKSLVGLNCRLTIEGAEVAGYYKIQVTQFEEGKPKGAYRQILPVDDHAYEGKVVDCARFCLDKVLAGEYGKED